MTRIYPTYWLALLPFLGSDVPQLLTSITLWPWFGQIHLPFLTVGWTLCYELLFYLAAGLVLWRRWTLWILLPAYALFFLLAARGAHPLFGYIGNPMILEFLLGVGIARLPRTRHRAAGVTALLLGTLAIPLLSHPTFGLSETVFQFSHRAFVWGPAAALIVWGGLQWEAWFTGWLWRIMVAGGEASYSLYLFHPTLLLFAPGNPYLKLALMPIICVLATFVIHWTIERPLTRRSRALLTWLSASPTAARQSTQAPELR